MIEGKERKRKIVIYAKLKAKLIILFSFKLLHRNIPGKR